LTPRCSCGSPPPLSPSEWLDAFIADLVFHGAHVEPRRDPRELRAHVRSMAGDGWNPFQKRKR
jgi:hypothetical protein